MYRADPIQGWFAHDAANWVVNSQVPFLIFQEYNLPDLRGCGVLHRSAQSGPTPLPQSGTWKALASNQGPFVGRTPGQNASPVRERELMFVMPNSLAGREVEIFIEVL
jgi:hypothetical protein